MTDEKRFDTAEEIHGEVVALIVALDAYGAPGAESRYDPKTDTDYVGADLGGGWEVRIDGGRGYPVPEDGTSWRVVLRTPDGLDLDLDGTVGLSSSTLARETLAPLIRRMREVNPSPGRSPAHGVGEDEAPGEILALLDELEEYDATGGGIITTGGGYEHVRLDLGGDWYMLIDDGYGAPVPPDGESWRVGVYGPPPVDPPTGYPDDYLVAEFNVRGLDQVALVREVVAPFVGRMREGAPSVTVSLTAADAAALAELIEYHVGSEEGAPEAVRRAGPLAEAIRDARTAGVAAARTPATLRAPVEEVEVTVPANLRAIVAGVLQAEAYFDHESRHLADYYEERFGTDADPASPGERAYGAAMRQLAEFADAIEATGTVKGSSDEVDPDRARSILRQSVEAGHREAGGGDNERRADYGMEAIITFTDYPDEPDEPARVLTYASDLVANVLHAVERHGFDVDEVLDRARRAWDRDGEDGPRVQRRHVAGVSADDDPDYGEGDTATEEDERFRRKLEEDDRTAIEARVREDELAREEAVYHGYPVPDDLLDAWRDLRGAGHVEGVTESDRRNLEEWRADVDREVADAVKEG